MMRSTVMWCIFLLFGVVNTQKDKKWCDAKFECDGRLNILCEGQVGKEDCIGQSSPAKEELLKLHRDARNHMKRDDHTELKKLPKACWMGTLRWDDDLAEMAEWFGLNCMMLKGDCQKTEKFKSVVRSVEISANVTDPDHYKPLATLTSMFGMWLESFNSAPDASGLVASYKNGTWYKGTQIVWAETTYIGCAITKQYKPKEQKLVEVLICNYAPPGNIEGQKIYETDCSKPNPDEERGIAQLVKPSTSIVVLMLLLAK